MVSDRKSARPDRVLDAGRGPDSDQLATLVHAGQPGAATASMSFVPMAIPRGKIGLLRKRASLFADAGFGEDALRQPVWDLLLDLYAARGRGRKISLSELCIAAAVPAAAALVHIDRMLKIGLAVHEPDPRDGRRVLIALSERAAGVMDLILAP